MSTDFHKDYKFSGKTQSIADKIYQEVFGEKVGIKRLVKEYIDTSNMSDYDKLRLSIDKEYGIDTFVQTKYRAMSFQEKSLRQKYAHFNTFTIELYQDHKTKDKGEFFHCCSQYYLSFYVDNDDDPQDYDKYVIVKVPDFFEWISGNEDRKKYVKHYPTQPASFLAIKYEELPDSVIYRMHK